ncbi:uncharacterized protein LOC108735249 [Agrilus planipennis]|uniref:Uncharacterized protein LOC108735249 n=1 Tax=Agrilus planipennis TaxID=224129 RepID=A0A1W4WQ66_AGRPL|nr:uncharacterized protein LOC108735249 [Agrilus planipennis]
MSRTSAYLFVISGLIIVLTAAEFLPKHRKQKRQLFRENVLPDLGGKIPEFAYRPDRISLNVLNQNGVIFNGFVLEPSRNVFKYDTKVKNPDVLRLSYVDNRSVFTKGDLGSSKDAYTAYILRHPSNAPTPVISTKYNNYPVTPYSSLKLIYRFRQETKQRQTDPCLNDIFPKDCLGESIFKEFTPYLQKLHELYR